MSRGTFSVVVASTMIASCSAASQIARPGEEYELIQINGESIPYDDGQFLPLCGTPRGTVCDTVSECRILITEGGLTLYPASRTAHVWYRNRISCGNHARQTFSQPGRYEIRDQTIEIFPPNPAAGHYVYTGSIEGDRIELKIDRRVYLFRRT